MTCLRRPLGAHPTTPPPASNTRSPSCRSAPGRPPDPRRGRPVRVDLPPPTPSAPTPTTTTTPASNTRSPSCSSAPGRPPDPRRGRPVRVGPPPPTLRRPPRRRRRQRQIGDPQVAGARRAAILTRGEPVARGGVGDAGERSPGRPRRQPTVSPLLRHRGPLGPESPKYPSRAAAARRFREPPALRRGLPEGALPVLREGSFPPRIRPVFRVFCPFARRSGPRRDQRAFPVTGRSIGSIGPSRPAFFPTVPPAGNPDLETETSS